ncbi:MULTISPECIES: hypothetical protein [Betaproteobacteria]|uniref:hypothetical protein n=1 Tax=Betaproteobacteria TaxID=28216 RepID=UPI000A404AFA|nr:MULTISPECIES: hypothetical protein [Betaproteobacteria]
MSDHSVLGATLVQLQPSTLSKENRSDDKPQTFKKARRASPTSQSRSSARFSKNSDLERLRVQTWFFHVVERAIGSQLEHFQWVEWQKAVLGNVLDQVPLARSLQAWLDEQGDSLCDLEKDSASQMAARHYEKGESSPREITLGVFDKLLPGSQAVYDLGLNGEPVWKILDGDLNTCRDYLAITVPLGSGLDEGIETQVQAVMDALIAPAYRLKVGEIPDLGKVQMSLHPVWLTRINEHYRDLNEQDEPDTVLEVQSIDDQILAALALWHICMASGSSLVLRLEWLLVGLCYGTIADVFNEGIQAYVLNMLKRRASEIDDALRKRKVAFSPFEARWKSVHGPESN